jgi:hypothetical protein
MTVQDFVELVREVQLDFEREEDRGLLQHDLHKAEQALAGKYACDRILRKVEARSGMRVVMSRNVDRAR